MRGRWLGLAAGLALAAVMVSGPAVAQSGPNGKRLLELCTGKSTVGCDAYVLGFADAEATSTAKRFCVPAGVPGNALRDILVAYLRANPEKLSQPRYTLALAAFGRAFPCGK